MADTSAGAFWEKISKNGKKYWKGNFLGKKYVMYENSYKESENQPDLKIYPDTPRHDESMVDPF